MISNNVQSSHEIVVDANNKFIVTQQNIWGSNITTSQYEGYDINKDLQTFMSKQKSTRKLDDIQTDLNMLVLRAVSDMKGINNIFLLIIDDTVICYLNTPLAINIVNDVPTYIRSLIQYIMDYFKCSEYAVKNIYNLKDLETELPNITIDSIDRSLYITI